MKIFTCIYSENTNQTSNMMKSVALSYRVGLSKQKHLL